MAPFNEFTLLSLRTHTPPEHHGHSSGVQQMMGNPKWHDMHPLTAAASVCSISARHAIACRPTNPSSRTFCGLQINGQANVTVIREASAAGVPRCAFISVHDYGFPGV